MFFFFTPSDVTLPGVPLPRHARAAVTVRAGRAATVSVRRTAAAVTVRPTPQAEVTD